MISYRKPFYVWNCSQIEGLEKVRPDLFEEVEPLKQINNDTRIESVDSFFSNTGITLNHSGNTAFYNTKDDFVNMPDYELFPDNLSYYSVLSHEFIHSTGHKKRLDRFKAGRKAYSFEELVAEIGSCFLNAQFGLQMQPDQNQFAYCKHWLDGLNNDQTFIISASAKAQKAVTIAPHPFSLIDALREDSLKCDLFEIFNSSNIDIYSNKKAEIFAKNHNLGVTAGSDSHLASTIGRCTNLIKSENTLDSVISSMKKKQISIENTGYINRREVLEHVYYKIENSKEYIDKYIAEFYPRSVWLFKLLYKFYTSTHKNYLWDMLFQLCVFGLKRISYKINFEGYDPYAFRTRDIPTITKMVF